MQSKKTERIKEIADQHVNYRDRSALAFMICRPASLAIETVKNYFRPPAFLRSLCWRNYTVCAMKANSRLKIDIH